MSLYLGNLSPRVREDEVHRVFRRFGDCTVQVKDKFGFVIYQYPSNAERALRALRGKTICGEKIFISWSKRQPQRLQQRHSEGVRHSDFSRKRNYGRENVANSNLDTNVEDNDRRHVAQKDRGGGRVDSTEPIKEHEARCNLPVEDDIAEANIPESDNRTDIAAENRLADGQDFDRYEPYIGDGKEQDEVHSSRHVDGSSPVRRSVDGPETDRAGNATPERYNRSKLLKPCYECGQVGHTMRDCPNELKRKTNMYRGLRLGREDNGDGEAIHSGNHYSQPDNINSRDIRMPKRRRINDYQEMKRREDRYSERHNPKKVRVPVSRRSDYTALRPHSRSRSRRSRSGSSTQSKSISRKRSPCSRSCSTSVHPNSNELKSQLVLRSTSCTSLSVSPDRPLPSSSNELLLGQKKPPFNSAGFEIQETNAGLDNAKVEILTTGNGNAGLDNAKVEILTTGNGNAGLDNAKVEILTTGNRNAEVLNEDHYENTNDTENPSGASDLHKENKSGTCHIDDDIHEKGVLSPKHVQETANFKCDDGFVRENESISRDAIMRNVSAREISMVFNTYGLMHTTKNEKDLSLENYFGSARLWPWEIIYYRRLKKGPISTDNYARRLAQNEEFGIVDKYIRSSSGWRELTAENS